MASCTFNPGVNSANPYAVLTVNETSHDISTNSSVVSWELAIQRPSKIQSTAPKDYAVVLDGVTISSGTTTIGGTGKKVIASGTKTIYHDAAGYKTISFSFYLDFDITWSGTQIGRGSASGSLKLTDLPRASTFKVSSTSADMSTAVTFTITRAAASFTHKLMLTWGGKNLTIASDVATSYDWTIPLSLASDLPNSTSSNCIITCITYNGSTELGKTTLTMTLKVPSSVVPTISSVTMSEATSNVANKFPGRYIQNKSTLNVVIAASGAYSSTISSYSTVILNKTYTGSTFTSGVLTSSGTVSIVVTVTDSRGRTATTTKSILVTAYSDPTIAAFTVQRCDADGTPNDEGTRVKITYNYTVTSVSSWNTASYTLGYKLKEDADFTTLTSGTDFGLYVSSYIPTVVFNGDNSYDFILTVTDHFKSVSQLADIPTVFTLMDFHSSGTGMAIGKVAETEDTLEIALDVEFIGKVRGTIFDAIYPVGSIYMAYNHVYPGDLFGGTWERIQDRFLWGCDDTGIIGLTGGEKNHTLTVAEMPTHKHQIAAYKSTDGNGSTVDPYSALAGSSSGNDTTGKYYTNGSQSVGGSQPHNNMPPFIQVSIWRRTE